MRRSWLMMSASAVLALSVLRCTSFTESTTPADAGASNAEAGGKDAGDDAARDPACPPNSLHCAFFDRSQDVNQGWDQNVTTPNGVTITLDQSQFKSAPASAHFVVATSSPTNGELVKRLGPQKTVKVSLQARVKNLDDDPVLAVAVAYVTVGDKCAVTAVITPSFPQLFVERQRDGVGTTYTGTSGIRKLDEWMSVRVEVDTLNRQAKLFFEGNESVTNAALDQGCYLPTVTPNVDVFIGPHFTENADIWIDNVLVVP